MTPPPFAYEGPAALREPIVEALRQVVDPEVALNIVDMGLVRSVTVSEGMLLARVTMTSAACPVADMILEEMEYELELALPDGLLIEIELVWEPPWSPEHMSEGARRLLGG